MSSIKFSIIFPTRDRLSLLFNLFRSIEKNTKFIEDIEINIGIDSDDEDIKSKIIIIKESYPLLNINFYEFQRSERLVSYYNKLASLSKGEYIFALCDDCEIHTNNWDEIILDRLSDVEKPHMAAISDGIDMLDMYSCFPIVSRDMVDICGYIFDERCWVWGSDVRIGMLFNKMNSYIKVPEVYVFHNSYHTKSRPIDDIGIRVQRINSEHPNSDDYKWINETIEKLNVIKAR